MTTKVVDFLNESGGSNFTETAPRPPVYGEENELQSNGGNSTRSGSSHKSHVSSKSHSSSRSGTSGKGEHSHSPATTPRKSNLADGASKGGLASEGHTLTSGVCGDCEESEMSAPLGFEPEGSAANSPPYSENGTPPHLKWAENLNYLLDDSEGVELFKDFMERELEGGSEELQFWFACQGLKNKIGTESQDSTITNIQKAIYKRYVRSDKVKCISKDVRKEIADNVSTKSSLDHCIFDTAQEEVEKFMRNVTYPAFLRSDYYVQYVQNYTDSPKSGQSSGSNSARPVSQSGLLPVVHEDRVLETKDFNGPLPAVINKSVVIKKPETALPSRNRTETVTGSVLTPSSYPAHVSYAPVSAQDSELQSLSSDALTDDTLSITDSSVDGYPHLRKKHHRKAMKSLAQQNREPRTGLREQIIPRTEHAPKDRNIAETDPKRFADLLIEKLSRVLEERESTAKVEEKLRSISEVEKSEEEKLVTSFVSGGGGGGGGKHNSSASHFIPLMSGMEMETAESILDQHCSRIWASSSQHTPSYSPPLPLGGHQSPPRSKSPDSRHASKELVVAARKKGFVMAPGVVSLSASANISGGAYSAVRAHHHKKRGPPSDSVPGSSMSFDSGIEDHSGMFLCGTETHRHIHHHHHHHHSSSSREPGPMKKSMAEMEAHNSWRAENPAAFADFASGDHVGRGRTSNRKGGSGALRKGSETSSNIDSGISVMYDKDSVVRVAANWNNPTSEKVMKWMLDSETVQEVASASQDTDRSSSSHKRSHRLNQSTGSAQPSRQSSKSKNSTRSASVERSGAGVLSTWAPGSSVPSGAVILPSQPFVQDSSMPLPTPPNPITQLEEAKRRLETQSRGGAVASPVKSKSFAGVPSKEKSRGGMPSSMMMPPPPHTRTLPTVRTVPTELDTSSASHTLDSRVGRHMPAPPSSSSRSGYQAASATPPSGDTIVGIYMGQEPIPYRHQLPGRAITLAQIKTLVTKRGTFKYFFKRDSDEFGDGAVFEEITDESSIVPMWQGKIVVKVEKVDL